MQFKQGYTDSAQENSINIELEIDETVVITGEDEQYADYV